MTMRVRKSGWERDVEVEVDIDKGWDLCLCGGGRRRCSGVGGGGVVLIVVMEVMGGGGARGVWRSGGGSGSVAHRRETVWQRLKFWCCVWFSW